MIFEWIPAGGYRNFGDALTELLVERYDGSVAGRMKDSGTEMYFLIGSHIVDQTMQGAVSQGMTPVFMGCGWRGEELSPELAARSKFIGCRGPRTKAALERAGVHNVEVIGDSSYPIFRDLKFEKLEGTGRITVPHIWDTGSPRGKVVDARVRHKDDLLRKIAILGSAEFVLGGAMHACITAHAYGVPFAPYGVDYIDCRPKWADWLESIGIAGRKLKFCRSFEEGLRWYRSNFETKQRRSLMNIARTLLSRR